MGLVLNYYLSSALEKAEKGSHKVDKAWEDSSVKEYLEAAMDFDYQEGEPVEYLDEDSNIREGVVEDRRPISNFATDLGPESDRIYDVDTGIGTITVSEDDML